MVSRRDELRSHRFLLRRVGAAVVTGQPEATAIGRGSVAMLVGAIVAIVLLGSVAVVGVLRPESEPDWRRGDAVIVESETGVRYVYLKGALRPVLNYASARLILGTAGARVVVASHATLASAARGAPIGIVGAPDAIPAAESLDGGSWVACSAGSTDVVVVGAAAGTFGSGGFTGGDHLAGGRALGSRALPVRADDGADYLLWQRQRDRVVDPAATFRGTNWADASPARAGPAVIGALATGPDIDSADAPDPAPTVERTTSSTTLCAQMATDGNVAQIIVGVDVRPGRRVAAGFESVVVSAGRGVLVRSAGSASAVPSLCLLTDAGVCFPIADDAALQSLGYGSAQVVTVPSALVALVPKGPTLSRAAVDISD